MTFLFLPQACREPLGSSYEAFPREELLDDSKWRLRKLLRWLTSSFLVWCSLANIIARKRCETPFGNRLRRRTVQLIVCLSMTFLNHSELRRYAEQRSNPHPKHNHGTALQTVARDIRTVCWLQEVPICIN